LRRDGSLVHAYPYRPDELASKRTLALPYGEIMHDDAKDTSVFGLAALPHGDLIVVYDYLWTTPHGGGIARIDKDGHVLWYRRDYTDHWPWLTPEGEIFATTHVIQSDHVVTPLSGSEEFSLDCSEGVRSDIIRVLDTDGNVKDEIPVFDILRKSAYRSYLAATSNPLRDEEKNDCDPVHTNLVSPVGAALAARLLDVQPNDLLVSLRNINAIGIISRVDHQIKHLFKGPFLFQHSAQAAADGKIIMFDNLGASQSGGPSRVLLYDPLTGEAKTLIPNSKSPDIAIFSRIEGNVNLSADGTRALVSVALAGKGYETRLSDGAILTTFDNLHDVHSLPQFAQKKTMARFDQNGIYYVSSRLLD
jgi:hypothetical protein